MIILGAGGFASELLENFSLEEKKNLAFYDDVNLDSPLLLYEKFPILKNLETAKEFLEEGDKTYVLGLGNPVLRFKLFKKFSGLGGQLRSSISNKAFIGSFNVEVGLGCTILANAVISNSVKLGMGCLVYYNVTITHDCTIQDFVELSPGATLLGNVHIGAFSSIGANSTVLPGISVGKNVTIGAGAVVNRNLPDNCIAVGVPAKIIKMKNEF